MYAIRVLFLVGVFLGLPSVHGWVPIPNSIEPFRGFPVIPFRPTEVGILLNHDIWPLALPLDHLWGNNMLGNSSTEEAMPSGNQDHQEGGPRTPGRSRSETTTMCHGEDSLPSSRTPAMAGSTYFQPRTSVSRCSQRQRQSVPRKDDPRHVAQEQLYNISTNNP